ncbi:MAG: response regulator [Vampirovibrionia bacterium]
MTKKHDIKIEIDSKTIQTISTICELSGLETPDIINNEFLEKAYHRIKELMINLKKQVDTDKNKQEEDLKIIEKFKSDITELKSQLEKSLKTAQKNIEASKQDEVTVETTQQEDIEEETTTPKTEIEIPEHKAEPREEYTPKPVTTTIDNILVIANIGVIMHQLKVLFRKFGCKINSVKNYTEAIRELKQQEYNCILFDIQTVTKNDLMLIEALRKATEICHTDTTIVILTLPIKEKRMFKQLRAKGADLIIEKNESWHITILKELKIINE